MTGRNSFVFGFLGVLFIACSSNDREGSGPVDSGRDTDTQTDISLWDTSFARNLFIEPENELFFVDIGATPVVPMQQTYRAKAKSVGGALQDVTEHTTFVLEDSSIGQFSKNSFLSSIALPSGNLRTSLVYATTGEHSGVAKITLVLLRKTGAQRDFYFVMPYEKSPQPSKETLQFTASIRRADVAFLMDTTESMGGAIKNLKDSLNDSLLPDLQKHIPSVGLSVVDYRDYPVSPYGQSGDFPVRVLQPITEDLDLAKLAVSKYFSFGGGDLPEGQLAAMAHVISGSALEWTEQGIAKSVAEVKEGVDTFGGAKFRKGSIPVVVLITDSDWHTDYTFSAPTMAQVRDAFTKKNARFVNITIPGKEAQADTLSDQTLSHVAVESFASLGCGAGKCCTGIKGFGDYGRAPSGPLGTCRLNFLHTDGTGVADGVVRAISAIAKGSKFDVKALAKNDATNADGVDATKWIRALRAMEEGLAADGCSAMQGKVKDSNGDGIADTFVDVTAGSRVCFEVLVDSNRTVQPKDSATFYRAQIDIIGIPGEVSLEKEPRTVLFLVPPKSAEVK